MKINIKKKIVGLFIIISIGISASFQSDFFEVAKQIDIYTTLFKELNMYYVDEINPGKVSSKAINHMLRNLDPYTQFYDEQGVEQARISSTGEYGGIGTLTRFKNKTLTIREVLKNSAAEVAGLKPGDKILKIDDILVKDYEDSGVSALLNGLPQTKVNLIIERQNNELDIVVTRKKVDVNSVPYYTMLDEEVGYISFTRFNEKAGSEVKKAILALKEDGMKKVIIDVRSNPGGLLIEAVKISNYFLPKNKVIVTTKAKIKKWSDTYKTTQTPLDLEIPIAILINNRSASASEILAGSLQDYDRGVIIGERSFGKGLVQRYRPLSYGTQMKLTISKYYTPSGRCIQELDYTNRDDKGNIPKFSDAGREKYTTEKGRVVFGSGGIQPDVDIEKPETTKTTETLFTSDAFFNFATQYFYANETIADPDKFKLGSSDFNDFITFVSNNHPDFETKTEAYFKDALKNAKTENLDGKLTKNYENLLNDIQEEKINELRKNKEEILQKITSEIVKRYYYSEGVYKQKAAFDTTILKAQEVLNNSAEYAKILEL